MFTGIVESLGVVRAIRACSCGYAFDIEDAHVAPGVRVGDSVSVNGVCLTAVRINAACMRFEVMTHTYKSTNLIDVHEGTRVNLERALKAGDRISGHFVSGHVDGVGVIRRKHLQAGNLEFEIAVPAALMKWLAPKGSVALDGTSLTLARINASSFCVYIIPHTLEHTTLGFKGVSHRVNVECDILMKRQA